MGYQLSLYVLQIRTCLGLRGGWVFSGEKEEIDGTGHPQTNPKQAFVLKTLGL